MADQAPKGHVMNGGKNDLRRDARTASFKARNRSRSVQVVIGHGRAKKTRGYLTVANPCRGRYLAFVRLAFVREGSIGNFDRGRFLTTLAANRTLTSALRMMKIG